MRAPHIRHQRGRPAVLRIAASLVLGLLAFGSLPNEAAAQQQPTAPKTGDGHAIAAAAGAGSAPGATVQTALTDALPTNMYTSPPPAASSSITLTAAAVNSSANPATFDASVLPPGAMLRDVKDPAGTANLPTSVLMRTLGGVDPTRQGMSPRLQELLDDFFKQPSSTPSSNTSTTANITAQGSVHTHAAGEPCATRAFSGELRTLMEQHTAKLLAAKGIVSSNAPAAAFPPSAGLVTDKAGRRSRKLMQSTVGSIKWIRVMFHSKQASNGQGVLSNAQIWNELERMNNHVRGAGTNGVDTGFRFYLGGITRETSDRYFYARAGSAEEAEMKRRSRVGGMGTLNVWINACLDGSGDLLNGYATFPYGGADVGIDGVVIRWALLCCESDPANGMHEVGHWLNLYHTHQGSINNVCTFDNDLVSDTNAEYNYPPARYNCQPGRDTCSLPGLDPQDNLMSYSTCANRVLTWGQHTRMTNSGWNAYRASSAVKPILISLATATSNFGACLDVPSSSTSPGTGIQQWGCNGSPAQVFALELQPGSGNWYRFRYFRAGLCMDIFGANSNWGAAAGTWHCGFQGNQAFQFQLNSDNTYTIRAQHSGFCLDVSNGSGSWGARIQQYPCNGSTAQRFRAVYV